MAPSSQRAHRVTVDGPGIRRVVSRMAGGAATADVREVWQGGAKSADLIDGRRVITNIVLQWPYDPRLDQSVVRVLKKARIATGATYSITKQDLDPNGVKIGRPEVFTGCKLVRVESPDHDEESSEPGYVVCEFKPQNIA